MNRTVVAFVDELTEEVTVKFWSVIFYLLLPKLVIETDYNILRHYVWQINRNSCCEMWYQSLGFGIF